MLHLDEEGSVGEVVCFQAEVEAVEAEELDLQPPPLQRCAFNGKPPRYAKFKGQFIARAAPTCQFCVKILESHALKILKYMYNVFSCPKETSKLFSLYKRTQFIHNVSFFLVCVHEFSCRYFNTD